MAKQSKFKVALAEAERKLEKAQTDLRRHREKVDGLLVHIPKLQKSVEALRQLCQSYVVTHISYTTTLPGHRNEPPIPTRMSDGVDVAKLAGPQDLTGMGSHRPPVAAPAKEPQSENDTLPAVDGEEILP